MTKSVEVETVRRWLADGGEIAFLDLREEGQHGSGHPLLAVNIPYSRLETEIPRLVPRRSCRIVLLDDADGVAAKATRRLAQLGYADLHELAGGATAWSAAGHRLFPSTNVPSKAFAEIIEHECATPAISAAELDGLRRSGERVTVLDSRPVEEYARFHVPGRDHLPGRRAGPSLQRSRRLARNSRRRFLRRTHPRHHRRAIVDQRRGSQPGRIALRRNAGLAPRRAGDRKRGDNPARRGQRSSHRRGAAPRRGSCRPVRDRPRSTIALSGSGSARAIDATTYVFDVRTAEEFHSGHLPGSVSAPGGQLVQAIDRWVGTRGARLVLVDDTGTRAIMTAHWLKQMGWDVQILDRALEGRRSRPAAGTHRRGSVCRRCRSSSRQKRRAGSPKAPRRCR